MNEKTIDIELIKKESIALGKEIEQGFNRAFKRLGEIAHEAAQTYAEHKDKIDAEVEKHRLEQDRLQASMPKILKGDIVRTESRNACYEVDEIRIDGVISATAGFFHRYNEIIAVYRFDGTDFKCIWEREDYKEYKRRQS